MIRKSQSEMGKPPLVVFLRMVFARNKSTCPVSRTELIHQIMSTTAMVMHTPVQMDCLPRSTTNITAYIFAHLAHDGLHPLAYHQYYSYSSGWIRMG